MSRQATPRASSSAPGARKKKFGKNYQYLTPRQRDEQRRARQIAAQYARVRPHVAGGAADGAGAPSFVELIEQYAARDDAPTDDLSVERARTADVASAGVAVPRAAAPARRRKRAAASADAPPPTPDDALAALPAVRVRKRPRAAERADATERAAVDAADADADTDADAAAAADADLEVPEYFDEARYQQFRRGKAAEVQQELAELAAQQRDDRFYKARRQMMADRKRAIEIRLRREFIAAEKERLLARRQKQKRKHMARTKRGQPKLQSMLQGVLKKLEADK